MTQAKIAVMLTLPSGVSPFKVQRLEWEAGPPPLREAVQPLMDWLVEQFKPWLPPSPPLVQTTP